MLNNRVNDIRILAIDLESDASRLSAVFIRKTFGKFFPAGPAVSGLVDCGFRTAAIEPERSAAPLVSRSVKRVRAFRIHRNVANACIVADLQYLVPGLAAIRGFVNAAIRVRSPEVAERGHIDNIRISRMNHHAADVAGFGEAHVLPGFATIGGFVDTIAP